MKRITYLAAVSVAALTVSAMASHAARAEVTLKAVAAFAKTNPQTQSFLRFLDYLNRTGKGVLHVDYIGGPEVTPPSKQPIALRNGLFDLLFGPPAYYLGMFPEGDAMDGMKPPPVSREMNGFDMIDRAARAKLDATFLGRFNFGIGLHVFLKEKPKISADGRVDLTGLKVRSSGSYLDFLRALGATPVTMHPSETYTALERGVVDGAAGSIDSAYTNSLYKFVKYRIDPPFSKGVVILIGNARKIDSLPPEPKKVLRDAAVYWENKSMNEMTAHEQDMADKLAKKGMQAVTLTGAVAKHYVATYQDGVWDRVKRHDVDLDIPKAQAAFR